MSEEGNFEAALNRLDRALDTFEAAATRAAQRSKAQQNLQDELTLLREDRARLADELDSAQSRTRALVDTNAQVSARLDGVMHNIRALLGNA